MFIADVISPTHESLQYDEECTELELYRQKQVR